MAFCLSSDASFAAPSAFCFSWEATLAAIRAFVRSLLIHTRPPAKSRMTVSIAANEAATAARFRFAHREVRSSSEGRRARIGLLSKNL